VATASKTVTTICSFSKSAGEGRGTRKLNRANQPCGQDFNAADFLERHSEFGLQKPLLHGRKAGPATVFAARQKPYRLAEEKQSPPPLACAREFGMTNC
jgi:hypothetical protein